MSDFKNLDRVAYNELKKLDTAYEGKNEFSEADAKRFETLSHGWKCLLTAAAMHEAEERNKMDQQSFRSYQPRNPDNGQYMRGQSGHYPPPWMYPPRSYDGPDWTYYERTL